MFFLDRLPVCVNLFVFLILVAPCLVVAVQRCIEGISIKKNNLMWTPAEFLEARRSRAPTTLEMEVFVTLVNSSKPPTIVTKGIIWDVGMSFFRCISVKQLLKLKGHWRNSWHRWKDLFHIQSLHKWLFTFYKSFSVFLFSCWMTHSFSSCTTLFIWKYKDSIKIVWRQRLHY